MSGRPTPQLNNQITLLWSTLKGAIETICFLKNNLNNLFTVQLKPSRFSSFIKVSCLTQIHLRSFQLRLQPCNVSCPQNSRLQKTKQKTISPAFYLPPPVKWWWVAACLLSTWVWMDPEGLFWLGRSAAASCGSTRCLPSDWWSINYTSNLLNQQSPAALAQLVEGSCLPVQRASTLTLWWRWVRH